MITKKLLYYFIFIILYNQKYTYKNIQNRHDEH